MDSNKKITHRQVFFEGMNTVLSPEIAKATQYLYSLNCDIVSSDNGNIGVVSNIKGTVQVPVELPAGENRTIGVGLEEETNKMYFAVWNSNNFHTWFEFDAVSSTVKRILQSRTDTGDVNIFKWNRNSAILHVDIIENNLLYWVVEGDEARKFNIKKAVDKSEEGYGQIILEEFTRAYKRTSAFPPEAEYFTNESILNNSLYGYLFKFAIQFIYDDGEESVYSDYSRVPIPTEENSTGVVGVPNKNNGIRVRFMTGGKLVRKIRLIMKKTNNEGGESDWVNILVLDKKNSDIADDTEYEYEFYNNSSYLAVDQNFIRLPQSFLPREPKVQAFASNSMIYGNFKIGRPPVDVDMEVDVFYADLFIESEVENKLNDPSITTNIIAKNYESGGFLSGGGWRHTTVEVVIGNDVKKGNQFFLSAAAGNRTKFSYAVKAGANDTAKTIASQFHSKIANHSRVKISGGWIENIVESGGFVRFRFNFRGDWDEDYLTMNQTATPVFYNSLKNTGNSVLNDKMGAAFRYAVYYEDSDIRKSLAFGNNQIVEIKTVNELGGIKKVVTQILINHKPPSWATKMAIVRTKNLKQLSYIQVLIQSINTTTTTTTGEKYQDLTLGSLYTYQQVHPNATISYEFKKGDRIRYIKRIDNGVESAPASVVDYEILSYMKEVTDDIDENITIDGTAEVATTVDSNRIGSHIVIDGNEREIISINDDQTKYILNSPIGTSSTSQTFPSYQIINKRGILRIKMSDSYPIVVDPANDIYAVVEVYTPYQSQANSENENYYDIGYKFDITDGYHLGNIQDQTETQPAIIQIDGLDNYVRKREMITNLSVKNPSVVLATVEDQSFSDFYVSNLSSYGRATVMDDSTGEVNFGERLVSSANYVEGTNLNGMSMFYNLDRVDYMDKYGDIELLKFHEGRLYVFKHLKTGWGPVYGRVMTDDAGQEFLSASSKLLPEKLQYFLWEGGVGKNPESVIRDGNDIFGISANSGVIFRIGGNGVLPISKIFGIDNEARELITSASKSGVRMFGGYNRKKAAYVLSIPAYDQAAYIDTFTQTNYRVVNIPQAGAFEITSPPGKGNVSISENVATYSPNLNYSGMDYFSYRAGTGIVRQVCVFVAAETQQLVWRGTGQVCEVQGGVRTGMSAYTLLEEYDVISGTYTGSTKPNVNTDPDYIAPAENLELCPIGLDYARIGVISRNINTQVISFKIQATEEFNIIIREGVSASGTIIAETGAVSSGTHSLTVPIASSDATVYIVSPTSAYNGITEVSVTGAYFKSARFNDLAFLTSIELNQSAIPASHNLVFNELDIAQNELLTKLVVINHKLPSVSLSSNPLVSYLDLSYGSKLVALNIGNWSALKTVIIHESAFTEEGFSTAFINSFLTTLNANSVSGTLLKYGPSNSSGIRPAGDVLVAYNSLVSKGFNIIGRVPMVEPPSAVNLSAHISYADDFSVQYSIQLSEPLTVDIYVEGVIEYYNLGNNIAMTLLAHRLNTVS